MKQRTREEIQEDLQIQYEEWGKCGKKYFELARKLFEERDKIEQERNRMLNTPGYFEDYEETMNLQREWTKWTLEIQKAYQESGLEGAFSAVEKLEEEWKNFDARPGEKS